MIKTNNFPAVLKQYVLQNHFSLFVQRKGQVINRKLNNWSFFINSIHYQFDIYVNIVFISYSLQKYYAKVPGILHECIICYFVFVQMYIN